MCVNIDPFDVFGLYPSSFKFLMSGFATSPGLQIRSWELSIQEEKDYGTIRSWLSKYFGVAILTHNPPWVPEGNSQCNSLKKSQKMYYLTNFCHFFAFVMLGCKMHPLPLTPIAIHSLSTRVQSEKGGEKICSGGLWVKSIMCVNNM